MLLSVSVTSSVHVFVRRTQYRILIFESKVKGILVRIVLNLQISSILSFMLKNLEVDQIQEISLALTITSRLATLQARTFRKRNRTQRTANSNGETAPSWIVSSERLRAALVHSYGLTTDPRGTR